MSKMGQELDKKPKPIIRIVDPKLDLRDRKQLADLKSMRDVKVRRSIGRI